MKRSYLIAGGIAVAVTGWVLSGQVSSNIPDDGAKPTTVEVAETPPQVRVRTLLAEERMRELVLFGRTEAVRAVKLRAETTGRVAKQAVKKGQRVEKSAVIIRLALDDRMARMAEAEALVAQRRIAYEAALKLSQKQFRSKIKLAEEKANLEAAKASLASIKLDIERTVIRAPFAGVVNDLPVEVGDYVAVGDPVAELVDLDPLLVVGEVAERDVAKVAIGAPVRLRLSTGEEAEGKIRYLSKVGAKATHTFRVEVALDNPGGILTEGMTTEMRLPMGRVRAHRLSPAVLTLSDEGVVGVKTVNAENTVEFVGVKMIADTPDGIWLSGLPDRVTVITVGQEFVLPGQEVRPVPETEEGAS